MDDSILGVSVEYDLTEYTTEPLGRDDQGPAGTLWFPNADGARTWMLDQCARHEIPEVGPGLRRTPLEVLEQGLTLYSAGEPLFEVTLAAMPTCTTPPTHPLQKEVRTP